VLSKQAIRIVHDIQLLHKLKTGAWSMDLEQVMISQGVSAKVGSPHEASKGVARTPNDQLPKCLKQEDWLSL